MRMERIKITDQHGKARTRGRCAARSRRAVDRALTTGVVLLKRCSWSCEMILARTAPIASAVNFENAIREDRRKVVRA